MADRSLGGRSRYRLIAESLEQEAGWLAAKGS